MANTHDLYKRCPKCGKKRHFYRWDDGWSAFAGMWRDLIWTCVDNVWICNWCIDPEKTAKDLAEFRQKRKEQRKAAKQAKSAS